MFGLDLTALAFIVLAGASAGGVAYAFLFNNIERERATGRRLEQIKQTETERSSVKASKDRAQDVAKRRKNVETTLKDLDAKQKQRESQKKKVPLRAQLKQAGMTVSTRRFYVYSAIFAVIFSLVVVVIGAPFISFPALLLISGLGLPRWFVSFRKKRRIKRFLNEFPNSLDIIVRAVKSGLPLNDGIRLIATEAQEPVRTEFRRIVEGQQIGMSIPDAAMRMSETMPCPEAAFFGIVVQIQSQAGGNLSEALGNLSRVLRDRKKMKAKVQALSMEAKASAVIIGALPFIVTGLIYMTNPAYIMLLFTTTTGHLILGVSGVWMLIGVLVMRKMVSFEV